MICNIGWFILLTSLLSFWRVKRWERGILAAQPQATLPLPSTAESSEGSSGSILFARLGMLRTGLGLTAYPGQAAPAPEEEEEDPLAPPSEYIIPIDPNDPERTDRLARAYADEARLHRDLRAAGLL